MMEMFTRTYVDTSKFPSKVKMDTLKKGEWIYEVRLVKESLQDGDLVSIEPIEKLQIVKRRVDDTFTFGDLEYLGKNLGKTMFFTKEEAEKCFEVGVVHEARKELG